MTSLNSDCPICKNIIPSTRRVVTPCNHCFCTQCFFKWMKEGKNCPLCRKIFIEDPTHDAENRLRIINQQIVDDYNTLISLRDKNANLMLKNIELTENNDILFQEGQRLKRDNILHRDLKKIYKEKLIELHRQIDYKKDWLELYNTKINIQRAQNRRN